MHGGRRELRRAKRTRRRNAAWIRLAGNGRSIPCVLWDISEGGARVAAPRPDVLPAVFNLFLNKDGSSQRLCKVVWRNDRQLGVQFCRGSAADIELDGVHARQVSVTAAASATARTSPPIATASLMLPGYGPDFVEKAGRRGVPISYFAAGIMFVLMAASVLFVVAGAQSVLDAPWAVELCASAANFCKNPEWTAVPTALMSVVYLAVKGMEL